MMNKGRNKNRPKLFVYSEYEKTGYTAVDMVAKCVSHFRHIHKPIKTIYLHQKFYDQFKKWVELNMKAKGQEFNEEQTFQFDGVNIELKSKVYIGTIYWDFYDETPNTIN